MNWRQKMKDNGFIKVLEQSYVEYLNTHRRSNAKLKILHGAIARDLQNRLGKNFAVVSYGIGSGKESKLSGRYFNKQVDIAVCKKDVELGGIAVKYIMSNYSQNSNNYFEDMLGETANIRSGNKAYFQVIILPEQVLYFSKTDDIAKTENITEHNLTKYIKLSNDNTSEYMHTPNKTLLYLIKTPNIDIAKVKTREQLKTYLLTGEIKIETSKQIYNFGNTVIYNNYDNFMEKITHYFLSL